jgi:hypothetical protein
VKRSDDLTVFITRRETICEECGEDLGRSAWITLTREKGALCLACADLDHLVFLPAGDAALTRRSRKHSTLVAVVLIDKSVKHWTKPVEPILIKHRTGKRILIQVLLEPLSQVVQA